LRLGSVAHVKRAYLFFIYLNMSHICGIFVAYMR